MKLASPVNANYAAVVVRVSRLVKLEGLDHLVGVPVLGHQALTQNDQEVGELAIVFTAETQLSDEYARLNNLYREPERNYDPNQKGYLEHNRRIRAIKLRGHRSDALLMSLDSVQYAINPGDLQEGDVFDVLNGYEICRKYEVPVKASRGNAKSKVERAFRRVDKKIFPEHLETDQYWRSKHLLKPGREVVVTQKVHGTSIRVGRVPCLRQKGWIERKLNRWFPTTDYTYDAVFGSRKVIKDVNNPNQQHFYQTDGDDLWTHYGKTIADLIPEGFMAYGELVGFTPQGEAIQKNYTYGAAPKTAELYVYRVATINAQGTLADLSWDGVKEFCRDRGLKWCPELIRVPIDRPEDLEADEVDDESPYDTLDEILDDLMDVRLAEFPKDYWDYWGWWNEQPLPLSNKKTVDEGVCIRQEGIVPTILKSKSPIFLEHETRMLDGGEVDLESAV